MTPKIKFTRGTKVAIVKAVDERQRQLYSQYEDYIGNKGVVIGISAIMSNVPNNTTILENSINLYEIDIGETGTILVPEEMIKTD